MAAPNCIPTNSAHPCQELFFVDFLIPVIPPGLKGYHIMVLICTSLMINDVDYLFLCQLAIFMSSLEKCSIHVVYQIFNQIVDVCVLSSESSLYILNIISLSIMSFVNNNIFSQSVDYLLVLLMVSFNVQGIFNFNLM